MRWLIIFALYLMVVVLFEPNTPAPPERQVIYDSVLERVQDTALLWSKP